MDYCSGLLKGNEGSGGFGNYSWGSFMLRVRTVAVHRLSTVQKVYLLLNALPAFPILFVSSITSGQKAPKIVCS